MKKIFLPILFLIPCALLAQPTLTYKTHGLVAGEHHSMQKVDYLSPGNTGSNQVWDYSGIPSVTAGRTESIENGTNGKLQVTSADGAKFTYVCNEKANVYEGNESPSRTVKFDQPITKVKYPFTYGSTLYGTFEGHVFYGSNQSNAGTIAGTYSSEADAYGVLLLPNDVKLHNVLRVKTRESYVEQMCSNIQIDIVKYLWYAPEYRYPVFVTWEITYTYENGKTSTLNESFYTTAKLATNQEKPVTPDDKVTPKPAVVPEINYTVYPNPYSDYFHLTYTLEKETIVDIALYSNTGQFIAYLVKNKKQNGVQHITYNPNSLDISGFYHLRLTFDGKIYTQPLIKK